MIDQEENQFFEVQELLEKILKQEFIAPDEVDEYSRLFKQVFLTIENKEEFFPFIAQFLEKAEQNDEYVEERIDALRTEIESFFDKIGTNFSIHHIAGYKDPEDQVKSGNSSEDIDESFSFIKANNLNDNLFGPEIPEKHKAMVQKVLEKISALALQKQTQRIQIITQWRYLRLANQIQKLKQQSPAINTIHKFLNKKYNLFYKLRSWSRYNDNKARLLNSQDMITKYEKEIEDLRNQLEKEINGKPKEIIKKEIDPSLLEKIKKLQTLLDQNNLERQNLKKQLSDKDKDELEKNKKQIEADKKLNELQQLLANLKRQQQRLQNLNQDKDKQLDDKQQMLSDSKKKIQDLLNQYKALDEKYKSKNLNHFQKFRFFMRVMNIFMLRMKAFGFMKIFKRKEKAKIALMNVTDRIKARLLIQTRNHNCGKDIRKSFLKWMIKANPDLMRSLLSKICLTSKINTTVSIWRMKKLVEKPFVAKLPEAVKAVRRLKAFFQLSNVVENNNKKDLKSFVDLINPHRFSIKGNKLKKAFDNGEENNKKKLKEIFKRLRDHRNIQRNIIQKMIDNYLLQQRIAFWILKLKKREKLNFDDLMKVNRLCQRLRDNKFISGKNFFQKFQNQNRIADLLNKLISKYNLKKQKAINSLRENNFQKQVENLQEQQKEGSLQSQKLRIFEDLAFKQKEKMRRALWKMIMNQNDQERQDERNLYKLRNAFKTAFSKQGNTLKELVGQLKKHNNQEQEKTSKKNRLTEQLFKKSESKRNKTFAQLLDFMKEKKQKDENDSSLLKKLLRILRNSQKQKLKEVLGQLRRNKNEKQDDEENKEKLIKKLIFLKGRNLLKDALQRLRDFNNNEGRLEKENKIKEYFLRLLRQKQQIKQHLCLLALVNNKVEQENLDSIKHKLKELLCNRLKNNSKDDLVKCFYKLINHKNDLENQDKDSEFKKKFAIQSIKTLAQNQQRQIVEGLKSQALQKRGDKKNVALFNLVNGNKRKMKNALETLKQSLQSASKVEQKKEAAKRKLLFGLRSNLKEKLIKIFGQLQLNSLRRQLEEEKERNKKMRLLRDLVNKLNSKKKTAMYRLLLSDLKAQFESLKEKNKQQNFLNLLKRLDHKKKQAFKNLLKNARALKSSEQEKMESQKKAINQLIQSQERKKQKASNEIIKTALKNKFEDELQAIRDKFAKIAADRKKKGILYLLIAAQEEKMRRAMLGLRKWCKDKHNEEVKKNNKLGKILNKCITNYNKALLKCIQHLYDNKEDAKKKQIDKDKFRQKQYSLLGLDPGLINQNNEAAKKIKSIATDSKQLNIPIKRHILDLLEYMKNNNANEKYNQLIKKIEKGQIEDTTELLDFVNLNNQDGTYDKLKPWINNPKLEMENLKHFMLINNSDGRYNPILDQMKKNPNYNKIDLLEYIDNNNQDGKLNPLKNKIHDHTRIDDILEYLRRHNKDGKYDKILEWAAAKQNPKLVDLQGYLQRHNEGGVYDEVQQKINEPELGKKQIAKLIHFMKSNNGDGRYQEALDYLFQKSIPKLSDLNQFFNQKGQNDFQNLKSLFNYSFKTPGDQFIDDLKKSSQSDLFQPIIKKYENKNPKITDIFTNLMSEKNAASDAALKVMDKMNQLSKYQTFMRRNNDQNRYDKIQQTIKSKNNAQLSDLLNAMIKHGDKTKLQPLQDHINQNKVMEKFTDFVKRKNLNGKYEKLLENIESQSKPDLFNTYQFIVKNKKNLDYKPLINEINGKEQDFPDPIQGYIQKLQNSDDATFQRLADRINEMSFPSIFKVLNLVRKNNKYKKFDETFEWLDHTAPCKQVQSLKQYLKYNKSLKGIEPMNEILKAKKPKLTDLFNFIAKNNENGQLEILKEILNEDYKYDLLEEAVKFMKRHNDDGKYNEILNYVKNDKDPKLTEVLKMIQKDPEGKYKDLLDIIEEKDRKQKFEEVMKYIKQNNGDGKYDHLLQHLNLYKNPNVGDVLEYVTRNNLDKKFDDLIHFLLGKRFTTEDLLKKLKENNKGGKYNDIIGFISKNPKMPMEDVINKIKALNTDEKYNDLLDYLKNPNKNMPLDQNEEDDFFKMLSKAKKQGSHNDLFDYLKQNELYDPEDILDYLRKNNTDGKFNDLIRELEGYLNKKKKEFAQSTPKGFSIIYPQIQKMRQCLQALRDFNNEQKIQDGIKKKHQKQCIQNLINNNRNLKRDALRALLEHKRQKDHHDASKNELIKKVLKQLEIAQTQKAISTLIKLVNHSKNLKNLEKDRNRKLANLLNKTAVKFDRKKMKIIDALRTNNHAMQKIIEHFARQLGHSSFDKKRQALQALKKLRKLKAQEELKIKNLLQKLASACIAKQKQSVKRLKNNKNEKLFKEKLNDIMRKRLLKQLKIGQKGKQFLVMETVKAHKNNFLDNQFRRENLLGSLFERLALKQRLKQKQCFDSLKQNKILSNMQEKIKNRLFNKASNKNNTLQKQILDQLRNFKNDKLQEEEDKNKRLNSLFNRLNERYLRVPFDCICLNYPVQLFRLQKTKRAIDFVNRLSKDQERGSYKKLKDTLLQQQMEERIKNRLVQKLVAAQKQKQERTFSDMDKFAKFRTKELQRALKKIKIQVLREQMDYLQKLKTHYLIQKRNKFTSKLNNMLFCVKKNHKANIKNAFHHWAGTEKKKKIRASTEILETLIRRRENNAYTTIKQFYLYLKFENIIQGLLKLIALVDKKETQYKREFIDLITIRNPWFQKVIKIWTTQCKPNDQIAFWRMRYGGNLKQEGVSAEVVLRIKKLLYISQKRIQNNIANGFWKIKAYVEKQKDENQDGTFKSLSMFRK